MPVTTLPLDADKVNLEIFVPKNAEESLLKYGFGSHLRNRLAAQFTADNFEAQTACAEMCDEMRSKQRQALKDTILYERQQKEFWGHDPMGVHLTKLDAVAEDGDDEQIDAEVDAIKLPDDFVAGVAAAIQQSERVFMELQRVREHPAFGAQVLELLQELQVLAASIEQDGIDEAYRYVCDQADKSELTIPNENVADLYFITYLPTNLRYPAQELLVFSAHIDQLKSMMESTDDEGQQFLASVIKHKELKRKLNSHWDRLIDWYGCSQETIGQMSKLRIEDTASLATIFESVRDNPKCRALLQKHIDFCRKLMDDVGEIDREIGVDLFQSTDIGHCFGGADRELADCLHQNEFLGLGLPKNGMTAVILEDDPEQMQDWLQTVESHSPYTLLPDEGSRFTTPENIVDTADSESIGLYLLDIENGEDKTAGIETAKGLLDRLVARFRGDAASGVEHKDNVRVVVWSRSSELVEEAEKTLKAHVEELKYRDFVEGFGSSSQREPSIEVDVMLKTKRPF